jgi:hypothetical protein
MMLGAADDFEGIATNTTASELNQKLNNTVTRTCREIVENRYPFDEGSAREVPLQEFARLFGAGGILDRFFNENLASLVDMSGEDWTWRSDTRLGRELSATALRQFQNAAKIREAFFPSGGSLPNINLTVIPLTLSQHASAAELEVNGKKLESVHQIDSPMDFTWPGSSLEGTASIKVLPEFPDRSSAIGFRGSWALYRLLNAGRMSRSGDTLVGALRARRTRGLLSGPDRLARRPVLAAGSAGVPVPGRLVVSLAPWHAACSANSRQSVISSPSMRRAASSTSGRTGCRPDWRRAASSWEPAGRRPISAPRSGASGSVRTSAGPRPSARSWPRWTASAAIFRSPSLPPRPTA